MAAPINDKPFEHHSRNGTQFTGARCDLREGVEGLVPVHVMRSAVLLAQDVAEFTAWHRSCIWDQLNGFQGYDCIHFTFTEEG